MEKGKKMIARNFPSSFTLARFVNLNKIEQQQIVQISETSRSGYSLFFYSERPLEYDKLTELHDMTFINDLYWKKGCLMGYGKEEFFIIPTSLKDNGQNLSGEEWTELLFKFNDIENSQLVR